MTIKSNIIFHYLFKIDKVNIVVKFKLSLLFCWLGIHRYKIINIAYGFGPSDSIKTLECKICGIKKIQKS